jgi:hypothetical protein
MTHSYHKHTYIHITNIVLLESHKHSQRVLQNLHVLPNTYYERMELDEISLAAKYQPSSGHYYIELSIVKKMVLVK